MPSLNKYPIPGGENLAPLVVKSSSRQKRFSDVASKTRNGKKEHGKDEPVKNILNFPGYLQRVDNGERSQDEALNFGVLVLPKCNADMSSSGCSLSRHKMQISSHSSRPSSRNVSEVKLENGMRTDIGRTVVSGRETSSSGIRRNEVVRNSYKNSNPGEPKSVVLILPKYSANTNCADIVHNPKTTLPFDGNSREPNEETLLDVSCSSEIPSSQPKYIESFTTESKSFQEKEINDTIELGAVKGFVASPSRRFSFGFGKLSRTFSSKENPGPIKSEPSHRFSSDEVHSSAELYPFSLISLPLLTGKETLEEPRTRQHSLTNESKTSQKQSNEDLIRPTNHSSPNRRFGFSLGKMKRSFSSKGSLSNPQSSPPRAKVSDRSVFPNENRGNLHSNSRSSPLRRLLDPILKTKVTYRCPSVETGISSKPTPILASDTEVYKNTKPKESSMVQALLQTTIKNGLPLFKLVINNSCNILVAIKNTIPSGKQDFDSIYTFYAVHEIKKKSGSWINQGHKEKGHGFGYNVVGQMKGFVKFHVDKFENRYTEKEFVLCTVDSKQRDGEAPELVPISELASTIVKIPNGKLNDHGDDINIGKELTGKEFFEYLEEEKYLFGRGESDKFYDTTVILSGGEHGLPNVGTPSPLIQRWRSGGECDCGGWDIGCKLQILGSKERSDKLPEPLKSCSIRDHFDLFDQGGALDSKPIFSLAPFKKGIYSIEFNSSISLLQTLSICIAAISSRQSLDLSDLNSHENLLEDSNLN